MDNIVIDSSDSDSDYEDSSDGHSEEEVYMNQKISESYKKNRMKKSESLFTPDIEEVDIFVESKDTANVNDYTYPLFSINMKLGSW